MSKYNKALVALSGFAVAFASAANDGDLGQSDAKDLAFAALTAFFVWLVPNQSKD